MEILDADLSRFEQGDATARRAVVDGVMHSLATGFVYLEHDLSQDFLDECYAGLSHFFALSTAEKMRSAAPGSRGQRGYTGLRVETAASSDEPDWKEMLNWGETAPAGHPLGQRFPDRYAPSVFPEKEVPGLSALLMELHRQLQFLQMRFLRIIATGLGAHEHFFDDMVTHGAALSRAIHYPPMTTLPPSSAKTVWAAEHADINLVTALPRATAPGLQVKTNEGWIDAAPPEGRAILNTGMMLEHLSNGILPAGVHRVVAAPEQREARVAVVQFCHPTPTTILVPMQACVDAAHPERFGAISAADRLDEVLWEINLVDTGDPDAS